MEEFAELASESLPGTVVGNLGGQLTDRTTRPQLTELSMFQNLVGDHEFIYTKSGIATPAQRVG